uniref:actin nucleation-promoting factor WASL-like n=1 Tax=Doryrhamphus excisus TaxID=161450 RepID=UPI0025ADE8AC|nr:actin nucleation-promoting factor WASL-like [Doryrhamphus excisus]
MDPGDVLPCRRPLSRSAPLCSSPSLVRRTQGSGVALPLPPCNRPDGRGGPPPSPPPPRPPHPFLCAKSPQPGLCVRGFSDVCYARPPDRLTLSSVCLAASLPPCSPSSSSLTLSLSTPTDTAPPPPPAPSAIRQISI